MKHARFLNPLRSAPVAKVDFRPTQERPDPVIDLGPALSPPDSLRRLTALCTMRHFRSWTDEEAGEVLRLAVALGPECEQAAIKDQAA